MIAPAALLVAGCGGRIPTSDISTIIKATGLTIHTESNKIDTNGSARYTATMANGDPVKVEWSVSGGDPRAGAGKINAGGLYTPPGYLTEDEAKISVSAVLSGTSDDFGKSSATAVLVVTPGFLQPLTPGNLSIGAGGTVTISGSMTEVGGSSRIRFALAAGPGATPQAVISGGAAGTLGSPHCVRGSVAGANPAYTVCTVTYTAPATIPAVAASLFVVGSVVGSEAASPTLSWTRILLNPSGISSNPATHQARLAVPVQPWLIERQ